MPIQQRRSRALPLASVVVLVIALLIAFLNRTQRVDNQSSAANDDLNRRPLSLQYTKHARCRMDCRQVTEAEVRDILEHGRINLAKSDLNDKPCPSFAVEGYSQQDKQHLRIVFGQCGNSTKVITCIDLDHDFTCNCN